MWARNGPAFARSPRWHVRSAGKWLSSPALMQNTIVHHEGAASLETARTKIKLCASIIKIGLDVHARIYVAVAQYDQLLPKPADAERVCTVGGSVVASWPHGTCGL